MRYGRGFLVLTCRLTPDANAKSLRLLTYIGEIFPSPTGYETSYGCLRPFRRVEEVALSLQLAYFYSWARASKSFILLFLELILFICVDLKRHLALTTPP